MSSQYYFGKGLHDAEVLQINEIQLSYDYHEKNPRRNYLEIKLNSSQALFDSNVKAVRLYNYKIIEGDLSLIGTWWLDDQIVSQGPFWVIKMQFRSQSAIHKLTVKCSGYELIK